MSENHSESATKYTMPAREGVYDVRLFGALGDDSEDDSDAIQRGIDRVSDDGGGTLYFPPGRYVIKKTIRAKPRVALAGAGHNADNATYRVTSLEFEAPTSGNQVAGIVVEGREDEVAFFRLSDMMLKVTSDGWQQILRLYMSHNAIIERCYFAGKPENAAIWLGATLFTVIQDNYFGLQRGHGIDAIEANCEPNCKNVYYGTNWSQIVRNRFTVNYSAFIGNGNLLFSENAIESKHCSSKAKVIISGGRSYGYASIINNYAEIYDHPEVGIEFPDSPRFPPKFLLLEGGVNLGKIDRNWIALNGQNPKQAGAIAIDLGTQYFNGTIDENWIQRAEKAVGHGSSASHYTLRGNSYPGSAFRFGDVPYLAQASMLVESPIEQDFLLKKMVLRCDWQEYDDTTAPPDIKGGNNISVRMGGDFNPRISEVTDASLYPGAVVRFYAQTGNVTFVHTAHHRDRFSMKDGTDKTLDMGQIAEFMVSPEGTLVEL